jgi:hypothetical protein
LRLRITGHEAIERRLGRSLAPALSAAAIAIAHQVQSEVAPYPRATIANSPSNPTGRWYERGYGTRRRTRSGIRGRKTSEMLGRAWSVARRGAGAVLKNRASYSAFLHDYKKQVGWAGTRGWITDKSAMQEVIRSGAARRIVAQAIGNVLRGR